MAKTKSESASSPGVLALNVSATVAHLDDGSPFPPFSDPQILSPELFANLERLGIVVRAPEGGSTN